MMLSQMVVLVYVSYSEPCVNRRWVQNRPFPFDGAQTIDKTFGLWIRNGRFLDLKKKVCGN
jgi:hypothetical protein